MEVKIGRMKKAIHYHTKILFKTSNYLLTKWKKSKIKE